MDNTIAKDKGQTTIYKTLHRKLMIEQHEPNLYNIGSLTQILRHQ